ncbi:hypothetical protein SpCBS45565_g02642 [Spizellomyces sp. 'palustris']|nr:hypothetical protein SpCBS45565_g02642 [Spizellomyces sp. 'palustris']
MLTVDPTCTNAIDDIEELGIPSSELPAQSRASYRTVPVKTFRNRFSGQEGETDSHTKRSVDHFLPGRATVFVKTWGCGHNNSDGEYMAGLLAADGYEVVLEDSKRDSADVWLLNSCTVKGPSEQTFVNEIRKGKDQGKKVVVAGCVPQASPKGTEWQGLSVIGVQQIDSVVDVVEETLKGNTVKLLKEAKETSETGRKRKTGGAKLDLPKVRRNPYIEIIPINTGCLNQCTYCKTKHARGDLGSYHPSEIIARVQSVLDEGVMEIWLTSEDTGAYGRDIGVSIVDLLWGIVKAMEAHDNRDAMLRVGMTNPPYILEHLEEIAQVLVHPRVYSFLHVPVQAASDKVLEDMRRMYTKADFKKVVDTLRNRVQDITIATDVICGFPTETAEDFEATLELVREYKFPVVHISQFYPRPGTPAARLPRLATEEVKRRSRELTRLFESYTTYSHLLDTIQRVLITERSGDGKHYVGHTKSYQQVLVPLQEGLMGRVVSVHVTQVGKWFLSGEVIDGNDPLGAGERKGTPKLVRKGRELVRMGGEDHDGNDGTELSLGSGEGLKKRAGGKSDPPRTPETEAGREVERRKPSPPIFIVIAYLLVMYVVVYVLMGYEGMRWSFRVALCFVIASIGWDFAQKATASR